MGRVENPTYKDVGNADLVGNIDRPTYKDVGNADLVGNIDRPTYKDVGNADLVGNIDRSTYETTEPEYSRSGAAAQRRVGSHRSLLADSDKQNLFFSALCRCERIIR
jgi:hypothetical protein